MKKIYVKDIINISNGILITGNENEECINFSIDTRTINKGDVFIGIKGENYDGNLFYEEAIEKGAKVCILENIDTLKNYKNVTIIKVENTIKCLQLLATYKRSLYNIPVIAITGSAGKTTTKDLIANVISKKYKVLKTFKNQNNHIGLPLTILKLKDETALVLEMGMNHIGEIKTLTNIAKPTIAIITNIGSAHIGNLGSKENILRAKLEIIEGLQYPRYLILNNDDDMLYNNINKLKEYNILTYGIKRKSTITAKNIKLGDKTLEYNNDSKSIKLNTTGIHNIYNSLCAICVAKILNINKTNIIDALQEFDFYNTHMKTIEKNNITIIDDSYNSNLESVEYAIKYLTLKATKRKIAVLGDILELGDFSKEIHKKIGKIAKQNNVDILILVGEYSKYIGNNAIENGFKKENIFYLENNKEAIKIINSIKTIGDTILVKASNGMNFKEIIRGII